MIFCSVDIEADQPSGNIIQIGAIIYEIFKGDFIAGQTFNKFLDWGIEPNWSQPLRYDQTTLGELLLPIKDTYDKQKLPHEQVFKEFWKWIEDNNIKNFVQWGSGDLKAIIEQSKIKKFDNSINLKNTYVSIFGPSMGNKKTGLFNTCKKFNLGFFGDHHNAYYDALNTAYLHHEMIKAKGR
jgi:hypothetical protein